MKKTSIDPTERLSPSRDYEGLLREGIELLQKYSGKVWTNYNDNDAGVILLEQLCYGLTDLGYRAGFPMADLLTEKTEQITYQDRMYTAPEIMTSAPWTINDYRKLLMDRFDEIRNVWIEAVPSNSAGLSGMYLLDIELSDELKPAGTPDDELHGLQGFAVKDDVKELLSRSRNLTEVFLEPRLLYPVSVKVVMSAEIDPQVYPEDVAADILLAVQTVLSPNVKAYTYEELEAKGYSSEEILNGPMPERGFLLDEELPNKVTSIIPQNLIKPVSNVKGVVSVYSLGISLNGREPVYDQTINIFPHRVAFLDLRSIKTAKSQDKAQSLEDITLIRNGQELSLRQTVHIDTRIKKATLVKTNSLGFNQSDQLRPTLPTGQFRNLSDYHSIQNSFPSNFGIGHDRLSNDANDLRKAQAVQLKGYLLMFEQLMANYFAQLKHFPRLLSFDTGQTKRRIVAPTFYFRDVYDVPGVEDVLVGVDLYDYSPWQPSADVSEQERWQAFKDDPFNPYVIGLQRVFDNQHKDLERKNKFLTHLLARFASEFQPESILQVNPNYGHTASAEVHYKSTWLKRFASLSANRSLARNYQADQVEAPFQTAEGRQDDDHAETTFERFSALEREVNVQLQLPSFYRGLLEIVHHSLEREMQSVAYVRYDSSATEPLTLLKGDDYYFTEIRLWHNRQEKMTEPHVEVWLGKDRMLSFPSNSKDASEAEQAIKVRWDQLKTITSSSLGYYLLEHTLLLLPMTFRMSLDGKYERRGSLNSISRIVELLQDQVDEPRDEVRVEQQTDQTYKVMLRSWEYSQELAALPTLDEADAAAAEWRTYLYQSEADSETKIPQLQVQVEDEDDRSIEARAFSFTISVVLPGYVGRLREKGFQVFLENTIRERTPAHVRTQFRYLQYEEMESFLESYKPWLDSLRSTEYDKDENKKRALELASLLDLSAIKTTPSTP